MTPMASMENVINNVKGWGKQTIMLAIGLRAEDDGEALGDKPQVKRSEAAIEKIAEELWAEAAKETDRTLPQDTILKFARKVFDWCEGRRVGDSVPAS
jgi:hypothetical protein